MSGQAVQITINVTDGNAAEAFQQVVAQLNAIGPAGAAAGTQAAEALDQIGEHGLSARENIRLLNDDLGLRIPRAMQAAIMQSELLSGAISMIGPGLIAMGGIDILEHMGESVVHAYEKYVELNEVIAQSEAVVKSFGSAASESFERASSEFERYLRITQGAGTADAYSLDRLKNTAIGIPQYQSDDFKKLPDQVKGDFEKLTGESIMPKDLDATIAKVKDYEAALEKTLDTERAAKSGVVLGGQYSLPQQQQMTMTQKQIDIGKALLGTLTADQAQYASHVLSSQAQINADAAAKAKEAADRAKAENDEITSLQNAARDSELSGIALLEGQKEHALDAFKGKYGASRAAIDAIDEAYNNKEIALWNQQWEEADKAMRTAQQAAQQQAHTGAGSIEFERQNTLQGISADTDPGAAGEQKAAANLTANNQILAAQQEFETQMQQIGVRSDDTQITGYARIADEAAKSAQKIESAWQTLADHVGASSMAGVDASLEAESRALDDHQNMLREMEQAHAKTMDQISKEEEQTARYSLPEWQQAQMKIVDAFQDRVREINEAESQQIAALNADMAADSNNAAIYKQAEVMVEQDADAKMLAARQAMNAQMQQSDEETRDKLATGLQSLFEHPEKFFESTAMKTGFQLMANEMLQVFQSSGPAGGILQYLFGMGPQMSTSTNPLTAMSSVLGLGGGHSGGIGGMTNPSTMQFQQGSTLLVSGSQALLQAATALQSTAGGIGGGGMGSGGFGLGGSTIGGAGMPASGMPNFSTGSGMVDGSPMPQTAGLLPTGTLNADGSFSGSITPDVAGGAAAGGPLGAAAGIIGGGLMGATSVYSAYQNSNPVAGAAGGAMGGMEMGGSIGGLVGGPAGALVGGMIGAIAGGVGGLLAGIFGDQGKSQAEGLDVNTIQPQLLKDMQDYEAGRSGYSALASDLQNMLTSANNSTSSWGSGARNYFNSNIAPEINAAMQSLQKQQIGGRSAVTLSTGQYHSGGMIDGFGDLATSDTEGFIHARQNEFVVNPMAAQSHAPLLNAINTGNVSYSNSVQPRMPASSGSGAPVFNLSCWDAKSVAQWMKAGGARAITSGLNQGQTQYSGVGR
jgi:hypothetical protein